MSNEISIVFSAPNLWMYFGALSALDRIFSGLRDSNSTQTYKSTKGNISTHTTGKVHSWIQPPRTCHQESLSQHLLSACLWAGLSLRRLRPRGAIWPPEGPGRWAPSLATPGGRGCVVPKLQQNLRIHSLFVWLTVHTRLPQDMKRSDWPAPGAMPRARDWSQLTDTRGYRGKPTTLF